MEKKPYQEKAKKDLERYYKEIEDFQQNSRGKKSAQSWKSFETFYLRNMCKDF